MKLATQFSIEAAVQLCMKAKSLIRKLILDLLYRIYPATPMQFLLKLYVFLFSMVGQKRRVVQNRQLAYEAGRLKRSGDFQGLTASLIFSRTMWDSNHMHHKAGSGRMQQQVQNILLELGFDTEFAGQEDRTYSKRITGADLIISLPSALARIARGAKGVTGLFTCNTHVLVRNHRLVESARRWHLPCEYFPWVPTYLNAYRDADYLLIAENHQGIANFLTNGIPSEKIKRYHNSVDDDIWIPATSRRNVFTFVLWASAVGLRKGLPALITAWQQWFNNQDAELHVFGIPTNTSDVIFKGIRQGSPIPGLQLHLDNFPAQDPKIIEFLGQSHVGVLPTLEDAQPSSLLEMASCGLPIITTRESGVDFTEDFCRYVPADSIEGLWESFQYWYERRDQIDQAGVNARAFIRQKHTWNHFRKRFKEIVRDMMDGR